MRNPLGLIVIHFTVNSQNYKNKIAPSTNAEVVLCQKEVKREAGKERELGEDTRAHRGLAQELLNDAGAGAWGDANLSNATT